MKKKKPRLSAAQVLAAIFTALQIVKIALEITKLVG